LNRIGRPVASDAIIGVVNNVIAIAAIVIARPLSGRDRIICLALAK
jgi:hypothetical protein